MSVKFHGQLEVVPLERPKGGRRQQHGPARLNCQDRDVGRMISEGTLSFSDDDGSAESRTSAAYPASGTVGDSNAPTAANKTVTVAEDDSYSFQASDFGFADTDTGDALARVKITALPGTGKGTLALDGTALTANDTATKTELDDDELVYTPPANANGTGFASFTFKVSDGLLDSTAVYTMTLDVSAVNDGGVHSINSLSDYSSRVPPNAPNAPSRENTPPTSSWLGP